MLIIYCVRNLLQVCTESAICRMHGAESDALFSRTLRCSVVTACNGYYP
jgi:hypothetical protein